MPPWSAQSRGALMRKAAVLMVRSAALLPPISPSIGFILAPWALIHSSGSQPDPRVGMFQAAPSHADSLLNHPAPQEDRMGRRFGGLAPSICFERPSETLTLVPKSQL